MSQHFFTNIEKLKDIFKFCNENDIHMEIDWWSNSSEFSVWFHDDFVTDESKSLISYIKRAYDWQDVYDKLQKDHVQYIEKFHDNRS